MDTETLKTVAGLGIGILLGGAILAAILHRVFVMRPRLNRIYATLMEPYFRLQAQGDHRTAYEQFTNLAYRKQFSLEQVLEHHRKFEERLGRLTRQELVDDSSPFSEKGAAAIYQLRYRRRYERGPAETVVYEVVATPEGYRLQSAHSVIRPGVLQPAAW